LETSLINAVTTCQSCQRPPTEERLRYRKGDSEEVRNERFLQCDICERYACADCLRVYDIISGYDFLCHDCAKAFSKPGRGH
jgi:hypothetical protein